MLKLTESSKLHPVYIATKLDEPPPGEIPYMNVANASIYVILKIFQTFKKLKIIPKSIDKVASSSESHTPLMVTECSLINIIAQIGMTRY